MNASPIHGERALVRCLVIHSPSLVSDMHGTLTSFHSGTACARIQFVLPATRERFVKIGPDNTEDRSESSWDYAG